jgi:hypothetical protein
LSNILINDVTGISTPGIRGSEINISLFVRKKLNYQEQKCADTHENSACSVEGILSMTGHRST